MEAAMAVEIDKLVRELDHLVRLNEPEHGGPYQGAAATACVEAMKNAANVLRALRPSPSSDERVTDLLEALDRGVVGVGMHEDNETEFFDVDGATETMFEAAQLIRTRLDLPGDERVDLRDSVIEEWFEARKAVLSSQSADVRVDPAFGAALNRLANAEDALYRALQPKDQA
jgi:hypothetical protein